MKIYPAIDSRRSVAIIAALILCMWGMLNLARAYAENESVSGPVSAQDASSPQDSWVTTEIEGHVDQTILIHLDLSPYPPPAGSFYTAVVDVIEGPEGAKPDILPGVPEISVRCPKAGIYRLRIQANLIEKSSCA